MSSSSAHSRNQLFRIFEELLALSPISSSFKEVIDLTKLESAKPQKRISISRYKVKVIPEWLSPNIFAKNIEKSLIEEETVLISLYVFACLLKILGKEMAINFAECRYKLMAASISIAQKYVKDKPFFDNQVAQLCFVTTKGLKQAEVSALLSLFNSSCDFEYQKAGVFFENLKAIFGFKRDAKIQEYMQSRNPADFSGINFDN